MLRWSNGFPLNSSTSMKSAQLLIKHWPQVTSKRESNNQWYWCVFHLCFVLPPKMLIKPLFGYFMNMGHIVIALTHRPLVPHICIDKLGLATSHYLNHRWIIVNWALRNKLQWNLNGNTKFSLKKILLKMSSVKWRTFCPGGRWVKWFLFQYTQSLEMWYSSV